VLPNANALDVIRRVRAELDLIQRELRPACRGRRLRRHDDIQNAVHEVRHTLFETVLIVIVVLSYPRVVADGAGAARGDSVSLVGTVFLLQAFGFTVNLLTLLAIVLSVGLVVDDAIVVVEKSSAHIGRGKTPLLASLVGRAPRLVGRSWR